MKVSGSYFLTKMPNRREKREARNFETIKICPIGRSWFKKIE